MKQLCLLSCLMLIFSTFAESRMFNFSLKKPSTCKVGNHLDILIANAEQFATKGEIFQFYEAVDQILPDIKNNLQQGMRVFYLVAAVPFVDDTDSNNTEWLRDKSNLDQQIKEKMMPSFFPNEFRESNKILDKSELLAMKELFLVYSSVLLKQFKHELNILFLYTYKYDRFLYLRNADLLSNRKNFLEYNNSLNIRIGRQRNLNIMINNMEEDLVDLLIQFYPTKAVQVKKYLKLAGYSDQEIPDLLDKTIGRVPKAAYLYKGLPKSKRRN